MQNLCVPMPVSSKFVVLRLSKWPPLLPRVDGPGFHLTLRDYLLHTVDFDNRGCEATLSGEGFNHSLFPENALFFLVRDRITLSEFLLLFHVRFIATLGRAVEGIAAPTASVRRSCPIIVLITTTAVGLARSRQHT